jgi:leucyl aminopeptidase
MDYQVKSEFVENLEASCLIVGFFPKRKLSASAALLDARLGGLLEKLLKRDDVSGKPGDVLLIGNTGIEGIDRVIAVGLGKKEELTVAGYRKVLAAAVRPLQDMPAKDVVTTLHEVEIKGRDAAWNVRQFIEIFEAASYRFNELKSDVPPAKGKVSHVTFLGLQDDSLELLKRGLREGKAIANGMRIAKDLANKPGNICTPTYLADQAEAIGKSHKKLKTKVIGEEGLDELGMHSFLSVSRGSVEPARLIVMEYFGGAQKSAPHVLVGKGLTFDAGGISLKPAAGMDEMKYDMCGGASVIGTMAAIAELQLPINVVGVVAASENLPSGSANKPGDIVKSMAGLTIEILNTDAEGRLLLCDVLHYVKRYEPASVVDVATLTGACIVALGRHPSGLWSNNEALAAALIRAGETSHDRVWRMPLWDEYQDQLKSNFADLANIGGPDAGSVTAACFLSRFAKDYPWAHVDVAGTAWKTGAEKGATGRPVPLLMQYILDQHDNAG